jgi:long-chain acyl-CoA synthetase
MRANLAELIEDFRCLGSERAVVRYMGNRRKVTSYGEMAKLAGRFAAMLAERNISAGDRVVLWAENSAEWIACFYGCLLRGVLAVPLDAYGTPGFATRVVSDVRPSLIVGDASLLLSLNDEWPRLSFENWPMALPSEEAGPVVGLSHDTPLQILFTSGTTGEPKGIVHTHGTVLASLEPIENAARGYMHYERLVHPLRFLHTLPLSHVFGQTMGLWIPPIFAAEVHFENRLTASRLIESIGRERISVFIAVPRVLAMLKTHLEMEYPGLSARLNGAQKFSAGKRWWRFRDIHVAFGFKFWVFITGGGALSGPLEQFWNALGFVLVQGYGMTETAALITLNHPFHVARGTLGKPLPGREVKLEPDGEVLVRGPMVSPATWSGGSLHPRTGEWLHTGDLAEAQTTGELRFLGRKSETIVTGAGVNLHPEDLEPAFEQQPDVAACAIVPVQTPLGPEPCAVLALRAAPEQAAQIVQKANAQLADYQRIRRWAVWPEPDLPRTSTGKAKRADVAAWLAEQDVGQREPDTADAASIASSDWLLALISHLTGERISVNQENTSENDKLLLAEDLHLDSLGRVQLLDALEDRLGIALNEEEYARVETLGQLRQFVIRPGKTEEQVDNRVAEPAAGQPAVEDGQHLNLFNRIGRTQESTASAEPTGHTEMQPQARSTPVTRYLYPYWPWLLPFRWIRAVFVECVLRPLIWLLASPRVSRTSRAQTQSAKDPMLIIANHVTAYDVPLLLFALPSSIRNRTTVAMSGEMLEDFRHARNMQPRWLNPLGPPAWLLITMLFNAFPLPRQRDFQRSFAHVGEALDRGFHVIVFPEGTRSPDGTLASFRPGIGLLTKQSFCAVLPVALRGLGDLKTRQRRWFRSGTIQVRIGEPVRFSANEPENAITARLRSEVDELLTSEKPHPNNQSQV